MNRILLRRFAWTIEDQTLSFKIKAEGVDFPKLAGGILRRCEQGLDTDLEPMGSRSVANAVKALAVAGRYAQERREQSDAQDGGPFLRIAFAPVLRYKGDQRWVQMTVVPLENQDTGSQALVTSNALKVGKNTDLQSLTKAIVATWMRRVLSGGTGVVGTPLIGAMGPDSISTAVKASAFALRDIARLREGTQLFLLRPFFFELEIRQAQTRQVIMYLALEPRPMSNIKPVEGLGEKRSWTLRAPPEQKSKGGMAPASE